MKFLEDKRVKKEKSYLTDLCAELLTMLRGNRELLVYSTTWMAP
jgi:hypothetical protein